MIKEELEIPEIWTHKLTKIYDKGKKEIKAVDEIDIVMDPGIHGFLGPNGAGKTTTINMLVGAISITSGEAKVKGRDAGSVSARRIIGFLPQDPQFYKIMTGEQYLTYVGELSGLRKSEAKKKTRELLDNLGMLEERDKRIEKYSEGMKQRIGIAAALIHEPEILLLDEPTSNLDPIGRDSIIKDIKKLSKRMSIFVSSHVLSEIEQMCEKVTIINKGRIVITDTIKNIKKMHSLKGKSNLIILNTSFNERILQNLKEKDFITDIWIDEKDNKIKIISKDIEMLQKSIPKLLIENNVILREFYQPESSLQEIFVDLMKNGVNSR
ncbi:MAG: ABC transporter ATP-binding protein [Promethearchaeota archaeon]